jgi:phage baseplate assembly protein W
MLLKLLGQGFKFPLRPDAAGALGYENGPALVEQSLRLILLTALGERVMRPAFGCEAPRLIFAPGTTQFLSLLERSIRDALRDWEPRIIVDDVRAEANPDEPWRVTVNIAYLLRPSMTRHTMVFPYYLAGGSGGGGA